MPINGVQIRNLHRFVFAKSRSDKGMEQSKVKNKPEKDSFEMKPKIAWENNDTKLLPAQAGRINLRLQSRFLS